jgi:hypothetical protein
MAKQHTKSYSKFTFNDLKALGLEVIIVDLFAGQTIAAVQPSNMLSEILESANEVSLDTEKARSEFIIAPILRELQKNNKTVFAVYSGFNFDVDTEKGLQGFCDYLLARLPLRVVPDSPIIAVVEAKLNGSLSAAVPQCVAEMYATRIWNEKRNEPTETIYGMITTGDNWLFLRYKEGMTIEVDRNVFPLKQIPELLGVLQHIVNQFIR